MAGEEGLPLELPKASEAPAMAGNAPDEKILCHDDKAAPGVVLGGGQIKPRLPQYDISLLLAPMHDPCKSADDPLAVPGLPDSGKIDLSKLDLYRPGDNLVGRRGEDADEVIPADDKGLAASEPTVEFVASSFAPVKYDYHASKKLSKGAEFLRNTPMPPPLRLYTSDLKIHPWRSFWHNIQLFVAKNKLNPDKKNDATFAVLMVKLLELERIRPNAEEDVAEARSAPGDGKLGLITPDFANQCDKHVNPICIFTLGAEAQGGWTEGIPWYESFEAVVGDFLGERRLIAMMKEIIGGGGIPRIMDAITIGELRELDDLYKYRFTRLSTPRLVKRALDAMPYAFIFKFFPVHEVRKYKEFDEGGIAAQIAGGPLRMYCVGNVDSLRLSDIHQGLPISQLKAIDDLPFYPKTIKLAAIILEETNNTFGDWKQLRKAHKADSNGYHAFRELVRQTVRVQAEGVGIDSEQINT